MIASKSRAIEQRERQQKGWLVAQAAARLLLEKYHVEKVALFGSMLDPRKIRRHSDVDLAVWGLPDEAYYQAASDVSSLSSNFAFDVVRFESAQPGLQGVILQQGYLLSGNANRCSGLENLPLRQHFEIAVNEYAILIGQIERELSELENLVRKNHALLVKLRTTQDEDYLGTVALNLHSFYSGVERMLKQIAQTIDRSVPDTADWHRQLLRQVAAPVRRIRAAVLRPETLAMLNEYCSFRHLVRNIYSFNLRLERVDKLAEELPLCLTLLREDLDRFALAIEPQPEN
jgi:predicted nucleotidyltransferase